MLRDRVLRQALESIGYPLKIHPFKRGADMVSLLADDRLKAGLLGDMPTLLSAAGGQVLVVGLVKQTSTSIVTSGIAQIRGLKYRRIGYVPISSAHHTLLQGLASAGLGEADVQLVPLGVDEMNPALSRGEIDAFSAWEPAPSLALAQHERNRVIFRGLTTDYFVVNRAFEKRSPEAARLLVAGFYRSIQWMRASQRNQELAAQWVLADGQQWTGKASAATTAQIVGITRRDLLAIPSAPVILRDAGGTQPLQREYEFLERLGKIAAPAKWDNVADAFRYDGLGKVLADPNKYQLRDFDYQP
jgi:NitT/TauT family transport system substrate-binding protein